jgi:hypothetical protein
MVNVNQTQDLLHKHFATDGKVTVDPETGTVHVQGNVAARMLIDSERLPVQFSVVEGDFLLGKQDKLTSLAGSPQIVNGDYKVGGEFTSLEGAPRIVSGVFAALSPHLASLAHLPSQMSMLRLSMTPQLPLLRLLEIPYQETTIMVGYPVSLGGVSGQSTQAIMIIERYRRLKKGKAFMLNCANDLKQAGFAGNARW